MKKYDYLIVGAGLFGATFAWHATQAGKQCMVIDRRSHVGGNVYCETMEGIHVHRYGPHIFHTSNKTVWEFVNRFVSFNRFTLCTKANYKGNIYSLPFNMNTFREMWGTVTPIEAQAMIEAQRYHGIVHNLEEQAKSLVGDDIYEKLINGYTEKQWGRPCSQLPPFIIRRLPVRLTYDNNYFNDSYQGIPIGGYNPLVEKMLKGCDVRTGTDFFDGLDKEWQDIACRLVYTGKIEDFFHCCLGKLQYRSLRFEQEALETPNFQGVAIMNFTDRDTPFTRIVEHKHFETFGDKVYDNPKTVITREYPMEYVDGSEAFYPVNDATNDGLYKHYRSMADAQKDVVFGGRLAEYRYYDMDKVIESAIDVWNKEKGDM
ncbi:MAG: UDP-galactopyranose mutase [Prevotella sp.]|nr:UDP-galactopyranose mutase [Prevotella sp.]